MSNYIGNQPSAGEFKKLDSIASSFNGSLTQFDLDYSTVNQSVGDATQLIVSLNGIIQEPGIAYTLGIGGGSIVFASAPASGDTCHIVLLGGVGGTATPSDGSVDASKLVANLKDYLEDEYVANGSQTTYTLTRAVTGTNQILLTIDGIVQPTSAYSISGTTLTISPALPNTTDVRVVHMGIAGAFNAANSITSTMLSPTGGTANQVLAVNASANGIEFQTVSSGGGSSDYVHISTQTVTSATAQVEFDLSSSDYGSYHIIAHDCAFTAAPVNEYCLYFTFYQGAYNSSEPWTNRMSLYYQRGAESGSSITTSSSWTYQVVMRAGSTPTTSTKFGFSGMIGGRTNSPVDLNGYFVTGTSASGAPRIRGIAPNTSNNMTYMLIKPSTTTFAAGKFALYGLKDA
jgi:hypothetical protein